MGVSLQGRGSSRADGGLQAERPARAVREMKADGVLPDDTKLRSSEYLNNLIVQPEMTHTGISQIMQIGRMAHAFHMKVIPHASIGISIYQAASLHAAAALPNVPMHEYQHSVFDRNLAHVKTTMRCEHGAFTLPEGPGLGIEPIDSVWAFVAGGWR